MNNRQQMVLADSETDSWCWQSYCLYFTLFFHHIYYKHFCYGKTFFVLHKLTTYPGMNKISCCC